MKNKINKKFSFLQFNHLPSSLHVALLFFFFSLITMTVKIDAATDCPPADTPLGKDAYKDSSWGKILSQSLDNLKCFCDYKITPNSEPNDEKTCYERIRDVRCSGSWTWNDTVYSTQANVAAASDKPKSYTSDPSSQTPGVKTAIHNYTNAFKLVSSIAGTGYNMKKSCNTFIKNIEQCCENPISCLIGDESLDISAASLAAAAAGGVVGLSASLGQDDGTKLCNALAGATAATSATNLGFGAYCMWKTYSCYDNCVVSTDVEILNNLCINEHYQVTPEEIDGWKERCDKAFRQGVATLSQGALLGGVSAALSAYCKNRGEKGGKKENTDTSPKGIQSRAKSYCSEADADQDYCQRCNKPDLTADEYNTQILANYRSCGDLPSEADLEADMSASTEDVPSEADSEADMSASTEDVRSEADSEADMSASTEDVPAEADSETDTSVSTSHFAGGAGGRSRSRVSNQNSQMKMSQSNSSGYGHELRNTSPGYYQNRNRDTNRDFSSHGSTGGLTRKSRKNKNSSGDDTGSSLKSNQIKGNSSTQTGLSGRSGMGSGGRGFLNSRNKSRRKGFSLRDFLPGGKKDPRKNKKFSKSYRKRPHLNEVNIFDLHSRRFSTGASLLKK